LWFQDRFRAVEALAVSRAVSWGTSIRATELTHQPIIWIHSGQPGTFGLKITAECTSAFIVAGFLALTLVLALSGGFRFSRLLLALGAAILVAFVVNMLRLVVIALSASIWGLNAGFTASHVYVGSVITILGTAGGVAAYLWFLSRGKGSMRRLDA
jgi:exosortase/archaeosortase family protein